MITGKVAQERVLRKAEKRMSNRVKTHHDTPKTETPHIHPGQKHLPLRAPVPPVVHVQPKRPAEPVREPAGEQSAHERQQVVEDGDGFGDDPRQDPERQHDDGPQAETAPAFLAHPIRAPVETDVDVFGCDVAVDDACFLSLSIPFLRGYMFVQLDSLEGVARAFSWQNNVVEVKELFRMERTGLGIYIPAITMVGIATP